MKWSRTEALEEAQRVRDQFESLEKTILKRNLEFPDKAFDIDWVKICQNIAEKARGIIEDESTLPDEMYELCEQIRKQTKGYKGIHNLYLLHDWILERADVQKLKKLGGAF